MKEHMIAKAKLIAAPAPKGLVLLGYPEDARSSNVEAAECAPVFHTAEQMAPEGRLPGIFTGTVEESLETPGKDAVHQPIVRVP
jgi:hypothetical protein